MYAKHMNNFKQTGVRFRSSGSVNGNHQRGAALVITVVVLFALTMVALASTDSNRIQSVLTRNAQFRLEAFNASHNEVNAFIDNVNVNYQSSADGVPPLIQPLIDQRGGKIESASNPNLTALIDHPQMDKAFSNAYDVGCQVEGFDLNNPIFQCSILRFQAEAEYRDTALNSVQNQKYRYVVFND